eukprot:COSAG02_NODE_1923_length_10327_cov_6.211501_2_plen_190_part_00
MSSAPLLRGTVAGIPARRQATAERKRIVVPSVAAPARARAHARRRAAAAAPRSLHQPAPNASIRLQCPGSIAILSSAWSVIHPILIHFSLFTFHFAYVTACRFRATLTRTALSLFSFGIYVLRRQRARRSCGALALFTSTLTFTLSDDSNPPMLGWVRCQAVPGGCEESCSLRMNSHFQMTVARCCRQY